MYESIGFASLEDFLVGFWEGYFLQKVCVSARAPRGRCRAGVTAIPNPCGRTPTTC